MYEFNWLLTRIFRQNGTGKQTDKETDRQGEQSTSTKVAYFSCALGVSCCLLMCFVLVCYGHLQPSTSDKIRFVLYYAYNIANI